MTGKRNVRPRHAPLKVGAEVKLKKDERCTLLHPDNTLNSTQFITLRAGTTGRVIVPKLLSGNPVIEVFLLNTGTKNYEVTRSNIRVVAKAKSKKKPDSSFVPQGFDLLSPAERASLTPMAAKHLAASLNNQRRAKRAMMEAIQAYADCTANVSHARRIGNKESGLT